LLSPVLHAGEDTLHLSVVFEPLRPNRVPCSLIIHKRSGGRWRFEVAVEATQPEIDDTIRIQAEINRVSSVSFKIANQFDFPTEFKAFFTMDSSFEFTVHPTQGVLDPYPTEFPFIVSFSPQEYGKPKQGTLVIQVCLLESLIPFCLGLNLLFFPAD
jgi:hypothetical protein